MNNRSVHGHLAAATLIIASLSTSALAAPKPEFYTVKRGEYLTLIARRYATTVPRLIELNHLNTTVLRVGQRLRLRPPEPSIALEQKKVLNVNVKVVTVNMNDPDVFVTPLLPSTGLGTGAKFDRLVAGSSAVAIINGGYFNTRSFSPVGDLVARGRTIYTGSSRVRTALTITPDNHASVRVAPQNTFASWRGYQTAVANGPYVLRNGRIVVDPRAEGYRDPAVWSRAARSAVGITRAGKLLLLSTREKLTLSELAKVMRALGANDAITLDGGSSVGLAWKNQVLIRPARKIAYGIAVYARDPLAPTAKR